MLVAELAFTPTPTPRKRSVLRVVQDGEQDCSMCRNMPACWKSGIDETAIITNLLVCRIKRSIQREKATRLLLQMLRPKLLRMARWVRSRTGMSIRDAVSEMESVAIETLLTNYTMGELVPPIVWLFNEKLGGVRHWAVRTVDRARKQRATCFSYGGIGAESNSKSCKTGAADSDYDLETRLTRLNHIASGNRIHTPPPGLINEPEVKDPEMEVLLSRALDIIHDGQTLPVTEYRILKFYLMNARENEQRMLDWVHQRMVEVLGIPTPMVSRLYGIAYRRVIDALGLSKAYLKKRGITPPAVKRRSDSENRSALSAEEIIQALRVVEEAKAMGTATFLDIAWALGVTDMTLLNVRKRYTGKTPDEIRALCGRKK